MDLSTPRILLIQQAQGRVRGPSVPRGRGSSGTGDCHALSPPQSPSAGSVGQSSCLEVHGAFHGLKPKVC